ncbi:MAG TPA: NAD(P)H-hydrate dehydratase, partial [Acidimicrobiales bacterium]|nr:NAD(P)H-hydrate dehydratase [Acidimicrobiales bacterium]
KPVLSVAEMQAVDAAASEPVATLIERAGSAVAWAALRMLGGTYGKRVVVVAGKGNNGADGRSAARRLTERGVRVRIFDAADAPDVLPPSNLVIDAAYGTGFRGEYRAPGSNGAPVLAVDIPSGVNGDSGIACHGAVHAARTVTMGALKPGLLLADGPDHAGDIVIEPIGLGASSERVHLVEASDVRRWVPRRDREAHKWRGAVCVIGGSPGLYGAAGLAAASAQRAGAGMVRLAIPGGTPSGPPKPISSLGADLPLRHWGKSAVEATERCAAAIIGPGLGRSHDALDSAAEVLAETDIPIVVDADALDLSIIRREVIKERTAPVVVTPHDAEFKRLAGRYPGEDRIGDVVALAQSTGAVVLLKGPTTIVADADGRRVLMANAGDQRLATGGTGDVLSGVLASFCARGVPAFEAAAAAAYVHGLAGRLGPKDGLVADDLPPLLPIALAQVFDA